ncbi:MAG: MarR family transcriptional regulator [Sulfurimonas sp.]|nr:MarR family transcriptional regulator [Sulfurimonas sp.]
MKIENYKYNESLGFLVHTLSTQVKQELDAKLRKKDITVYQFGVLMQIYKGETLTQKEIAKFINADEPSTARLMNRLEEKSCIKRTVDEKDKRKKVISLTQEGKALLNELLPYALEVNDNHTSKLSEEEEKTLYELLLKVIN